MTSTKYLQIKLNGIEIFIHASKDYQLTKESYNPLGQNHGGLAGKVDGFPRLDWLDNVCK